MQPNSSLVQLTLLIMSDLTTTLCLCLAGDDTLHPSFCALTTGTTHTFHFPLILSSYCSSLPGTVYIQTQRYHPFVPFIMTFPFPFPFPGEIREFFP